MTASVPRSALNGGIRYPPVTTRQFSDTSTAIGSFGIDRHAVP
jgi:hypothetical protein